MLRLLGLIMLKKKQKRRNKRKKKAKKELRSITILMCLRKGRVSLD